MRLFQTFSIKSKLNCHSVTIELHPERYQPPQHSSNQREKVHDTKRESLPPNPTSVRFFNYNYWFNLPLACWVRCSMFTTFHISSNHLSRRRIIKTLSFLMYVGGRWRGRTAKQEIRSKETCIGEAKIEKCCWFGRGSLTSGNCFASNLFAEVTWDTCASVFLL